MKSMEIPKILCLFLKIRAFMRVSIKSSDVILLATRNKLSI